MAIGTQTTALGADAFSEGLNTTALGAGAIAVGVQSTGVGPGAGQPGSARWHLAHFLPRAGGCRLRWVTSLRPGRFRHGHRLGDGARHVQRSAESRAPPNRNRHWLWRAGAWCDPLRSDQVHWPIRPAPPPLARVPSPPPPDQVAVGGTGSAVRIGDIEASTLAQQGPVDIVTIDQNGTLGRQQVATAASVANMRVSVNALAQVSETQFNTLASSVTALDSRLTGVEFRLDEVDRRARGGIAAAAALGSALAMPDKSFVLAGNVATYGGEQGYSLSLSSRASDNLAFSAGVAGNTGEGDVIAQAGFAIGF